MVKLRPMNLFYGLSNAGSVPTTHVRGRTRTGAASRSDTCSLEQRYDRLAESTTITLPPASAATWPSQQTTTPDELTSDAVGTD
jgi:hypothetical protein